MKIDTGSANTAFPIVSCTSCGTNTKAFDPSKSSTFKAMGCSSSACHQCVPSTSSCTECDDLFGDSFCSPATPSNCGFGVTYGGGGTAIAGYYGYDKACFGSMCANVTLSLIESQYPPDNLHTGSSTGILGLASEFNACNPTCVPPILDEFVSEGQTSNLFSICLTPSNGGVLDFGSIVKDRFSGSIQYVPMSFDRWYNLPLLDIQVGGHSLGLPPFMYTTTNDVIGTFVDSGTSVVLMNPVAFSAFTETFIKFYGNLPGISTKGFFGSAPCVAQRSVKPQLDSFPDVTFVMGTATGSPLSLPVPASSYLIPSTGVYCFGFGGIPSVGVVLGDVFMENYYIVHDRVNQQVGFAPVIPQNCK